MNNEKKQSMLRTFFGAYFHEDWVCEAESPEAVVAEYSRAATLEEIRALAQAILEYTNNFASDKELEENLFSNLGCYYQPSTVGVSAKAWLEGMASQLTQGGPTK